MVHSPAFTFLSGYPLVFWFLAGLRLLVLRQSKPFWPLALVRQAPPAIIFQALRRPRGAVLFRGLRSSSIWGFPFWLLWLTGQSSRPAFGGRLTFVRYNPQFMNDRLLKRYREYAKSEEAFAVLFVKKHLAQAKGHWVDIANCRRYEMSHDSMHFRFVVGGLFKRKINPKYPPRADYTINGEFDERTYYLMTRAITWETAHTDIEQQKAKRILPIKFEIKGVSYDKNAGSTAFFRDDAPPEIKALASNLQDRTSPLWGRALQYAIEPEFLYEVRQARILPRGV